MKKVLLYSTLVLLLTLVLFFKMATVYALEGSLTWLLETPVKVKELKLSTLELYASIKEDDNDAYVKINTLYPLQADVTYTGNADAFKVYQPIKAKANLKGTVYYKNSLVVEAELFALGAKAVVHVNEDTDDWEVLVTVSDLNLTQLQNENNRTEKISGLVNADINFHTNIKNDSLIKLSSDEVNVEGEVFQTIEIQLSEVGDDIYSWAIFKAKNIDYKGVWFNYNEKTNTFDGKIDLAYVANDSDLILNLKGEHNETTVQAHVDINIADSVIGINKIMYDLNSSDASANIDINLKNIQKHTVFQKLLGQNLYGDFNAKAKVAYTNKGIKANLNTRSFGGDLKLKYANKTLVWIAKNIEIAKVLKLAVIHQKIDSKINSEGSLKGSFLKAKLDTKQLLIEKNKIKNIKINAEGELKDLNINLALVSEYAKLKASTIRLKNFNDVTLDANLTTPYTKAGIILNAEASIKEKTITLEANSDEFTLQVFETAYVKENLYGKYTGVVNPMLSTLAKPLGFYGDFSYKDIFSIRAKTKDFEGLTEARLKGEKIHLDALGVEVSKLLSAVKQPLYAKGKMNLRVEGDFKKIAFELDSKRLQLNKELTKLDENLSFNFKGNLDKNEFFVKPSLKNRYVKIYRGEIKYFFKTPRLELKVPVYIYNDAKRAELLVQSDVNFQKVTRANLNIKHKWDDFSFNNITYKDKKLNLDIELDIDDLSEYQDVSAQELYGPFKAKGRLSKKEKINLIMNTSSLGGNIQMTLKDKDLQVDIQNVEAVKIGRLIKQEGSSETGRLNGVVTYNLEKKMGKTRLRAENITVKGIDIDKSLKELKDALGLNIFAMGDTLIKKRFSKNDDMNLSTHIKAMEFDVDITPDLVISKDIALATEYARFAIDMDLKHNGDIKDFEIAILDHQGCAIIQQKLKGNIKDPKIVNSTGSAVVIIGKAPKEILNTGGKLISAGAGLVDSAASFIWKKGLRQDSEVTLVEDTLTKGGNIFSSGKDMVVSGECKIFYSGKVKHTERLKDIQE